MSEDDIAVWIVGAIGLIASVLSGIFACQIFGVATTGQSLSWKLHQFWLNFVGSATGWGAALILGSRIAYQVSELSAVDFGLALVAFLGITGYLPLATVGLIRAIQNIASEAMKRMGVLP